MNFIKYNFTGQNKALWQHVIGAIFFGNIAAFVSFALGALFAYALVIGALAAWSLLWVWEVGEKQYMLYKQTPEKPWWKEYGRSQKVALENYKYDTMGDIYISVGAYIMCTALPAILAWMLV